MCDPGEGKGQKCKNWWNPNKVCSLVYTNVQILIS